MACWLLQFPKMFGPAGAVSVCCVLPRAPLRSVLGYSYWAAPRPPRFSLFRPNDPSWTLHPPALGPFGSRHPPASPWTAGASRALMFGPVGAVSYGWTRSLGFATLRPGLFILGPAGALCNQTLKLNHLRRGCKQPSQVPSWNQPQCEGLRSSPI